MGMFMGMSVITVVEVVMYCSKIGWITISKKRRYYMYQKRAQEKEHEKQLEATVRGFEMLQNPKPVGDKYNVGACVETPAGKAPLENDAKIKDGVTQMEADQRTSPKSSTASVGPLSTIEEKEENL
ncbi:hypothetical protein ANCCAN_09937 [Ancylostoma caninum]|uniref:Uncharacterized protein n=1 Tax=Ancylostoma caninum TaxID=29170 RepID=A0A368GI71_ANCCA|nr:hypothetical protein ANCCAN_09937 [Ancylostoma caninum]